MLVENILRDLVSFNTINDKDNNEIMNYICDYLKKYNFNCEMIGNNKKILIASIGTKQKLGFVGHTDTVNYKETFGSNPFELLEKDGNYYGLGTCDMKGGIAAMLKAVSEIDFSKLSTGLMLIFTYGEEKDFSGIKYFVNSKIKYPNYLIFGEPTNNIPMNGSKGAIEYNFEFYGKRAHSSMINESSNINAVMFLSKLLELNKYFKKRMCNEYEFKHSTMNYGILKGGEAVNIVSDYTKASCDFRITKSIAEYNYVKKFVEKLSKEYNMSYKIGMDFLPFYNNTKIVEKYEEITNNKRKKFFGLSEASVLNGNKIILGPGPVTAHEDREHISKESLYKTVENYKSIIFEILK